MSNMPIVAFQSARQSKAHIIMSLASAHFVFCALFGCSAPNVELCSVLPLVYNTSSEEVSRIRQLIEELASNNPCPNIIWPKDNSSLRDISYPPGYNDMEQVRVSNTISAIKNYKTKAFPFLIDRFNDQRYCYIGTGPSIVTVGEECARIISSQVDPIQKCYITRITADGHETPEPLFLPGPSDWFQRRDALWIFRRIYEEWWRSRANKTLNELQIESIKWRIATERIIGFSSSQEEEQYMRPLNNGLQNILHGETAQP